MKRVAWLVLMFAMTIVGTAAAEEPEGADADSSAQADASEAEGAQAKDADRVERARKAFLEGAELARKMLWGEALARFELSSRLKPHAGTTYNMGISLRALGHYTRARAAFRHALAQHAAASDGELAESTVKSIQGFLREIERVLATVEVTLNPPSAALSVDGRPLAPAQGGPGRAQVLVAGTEAPGPGRAPGVKKFTVVLDPGAHVFMLSRRGFSDAVVRHQVEPGSKTKLDLALERLPGTLHVRASEPQAAVAVDGVDVGLAPVTLQRPAGDYEVLVQKRGFESYRTDVSLRAAERIDLEAPLQPARIGLHERWWFWAALTTAVASTVVVTYVVTRPEPERPPIDGGGLGWTIRVP